MTTTGSFVFCIGGGLPADAPIARWITALAMAWNDVVFAHDLYIEHDEGGRGIYLVRTAAAHLSEILDPTGPFVAGHDDWPEVREFVAKLPKGGRADFERLRSVGTERDVEGSLGWRLDRLRSTSFHYPHLNRGQSDGRRLAIARALHTKAAEDGSVEFKDGTVRGTRLGFADEISIAMSFTRATIDASNVDELRRFTSDLLAVQQRFIRFGELAVGRYLRSLPDDVLRSEAPK